MKKIFIPAIAAALCLLSADQATYAQDYTATPVTISQEKVKMDGKVYYSHIVLERQTIYSISKAYGVGIDEIYKANPDLRQNGLKKNAVILIPAETRQDDTKVQPQKEEKKKRKKDEKEDFFIHTVRWYEDLDVIAEKYGVPVKAIVELNGLSGRKLKNRQKLRIPVSAEGYTAGPETTPPAGETMPADVSETVKDQKEGKVQEEVQYTTETGAPVSAVLMLPLNAADSARYSSSNLDFYSGVLLAAKDMGDSGIDIDLSVYDVAGGSLPITQERLMKSDVVIGPVSSGDLGRLLSIAPGQTEIVSPLDHRAESLTSSFSNFIQAPTPYYIQYKDLVDWIIEDRHKSDSVIVIFEKGTESKDIAMLTEELRKSGLRYQPFHYSILEGRNILGSLKSLMTASSSNHILIASESEAFVNDVVRNVNLLIHDKYKVTLYAPSKIRGFETIEVENLHNANLHVSTSYYIDYDSPQVQDFIMKYRALFNTEPTPFAFQGYDISKYFFSLCSRYGKRWISNICAEPSEMLQSGFRFTRAGDAGYINHAVRRIVYGTDFSIRIEEAPSR